MLSEIMLQQTQVSRVIPKFDSFLRAFPDVSSLASAPLADVLILWSGLGYNRRAKYLWLAAQQIVNDFSGQVPTTIQDLVRLPGIGHNTAGAILAYAYNEPVIFIETNIRTVYIHHFFPVGDKVSDQQLTPWLAQTVPPDNARTWYWALMDYGAHLKQTIGNISRASSTYSKQSKFEGSKRQIRGQILRALASGPHSLTSLIEVVADERLLDVLHDLQQEQLIQKNGHSYYLYMV